MQLMSIEDTIAEVDEMIEELEIVSLELLGRTNIESLCSIYGDILHGIICGDKMIAEDDKAAFTIATIAKHLQSAALSHFDMDNVVDKLDNIFNGGKNRVLN